ncbi:MAG: phosphoribosyl-ATP diphosphatase [Acidimicrobiia bacterium]|nr:phosphoribosyl-ATP diphosphatase [Acidimicrobiia bacterium]MBT8193822.1 phosphoribosyl-ATP diphosphatase [Acidimicrobiia bacterium]NNF89208.1 phosphoribosyl-ATP diphosphatase [Acidimicrobiia bacterium]NNJ48005.1 phosphoribosyl-ATP diphosphatase [Acidimicrobiia bacterium]NNL12614.1 phosphoribosyl-ATP diphosphatase [Acidimicrobiia bacterium]
MIIPSIDISGGRAVQLRRGRELILEGGDPLDRLDEFSVAGEVAVIDLDAARGQGDNTALIRRMAGRARCRVGGGIRSVEAAEDWLDAGAEKVILGTAASVEVCSRLPRERVIAAVDAEFGEVVVEGWETPTGAPVLDRIRELAPYVGGFLYTQVEHEGGMAGFDVGAVARAVEAAGSARVTAAGGITESSDIGRLHALGADAQVGMAIYSGRMSLGAAIAAPLAKPIDGELWPTVVVDEFGATLGLVWSTTESLERAVAERRGIYWSRSRGELWIKGASSGNTQDLLAVDLDCDGDALRFTVHQHGAGFCHTGRRSCWEEGFTLGALDRLIAGRMGDPEPGSGTSRLLEHPGLLADKLREEATELGEATTTDEVIHEAADLLYFALVRLRGAGARLEDVEAELRRRNARVRRRPMISKEAL